MGIGKVSGADVSIVKKFSGSTEFISISGSTPQEAGTHVFLLAGQSNMVGRPTFDGGTGYPSGTLQYPKATGYPTYTDTTTIAASPPLGHWDAQAGDMGLALQFTIDYVSDTGATVVLIPAADGGTSFVGNHWNPGDAQYDHAPETQCLDSRRHGPRRQAGRTPRLPQRQARRDAQDLRPPPPHQPRARPVHRALRGRGHGRL